MEGSVLCTVLSTMEGVQFYGGFGTMYGVKYYGIDTISIVEGSISTVEDVQYCVGC